jgi:integrase
MTPERWKQVEELYRAVREVPAVDRDRVLRAANPELRGEVESLLAKEPASVIASATDAVPFVSVGTQLGSYRIESPIGSGGMGYEAADCGLLSPDLAAGIRRVKGVKKLGVRLGNWLTAEQGETLWQSPDTERLKGKRDRALLAVLLACGLRRHEAVELTFSHLQQREQHWAIVDLIGKGGHIRTVPMPDWVKQNLDVWLTGAGINSGRLFRRVNRAGRVWGESMTEKVVWHVVREFAAKAAIDKLAPHDLRRTCARLCHSAGGELEQIQFLLGHVSIQTTERYLGCKQRIRSAVNDRIGIEPRGE